MTFGTSGKGISLAFLDFFNDRSAVDLWTAGCGTKFVVRVAIFTDPNPKNKSVFSTVRSLEY